MGLFDKRKKQFEKIKELLFPKVEYKVDSDGDKFAILKTVDTNLNAALQDLMDGKNDEAIHATLKYCISMVSQVREILNVGIEFEKETKYIIVDFDEERMRN